ncbi:Uncharacterised protein [Mycobacteroides abscessus subsp. abscessus]|nr:Uncharacterised protein [Mycobacteroides abscessus subsp. abscessus]
MIVGATELMVRNGTGAPAIAASSVKINWSIIERFWPPNSVGQPSASQPSEPICATTSRYASPSPSSPSPPVSAARRSSVISPAKYDRSSRRRSACCSVYAMRMFDPCAFGGCSPTSETRSNLYPPSRQPADLTTKRGTDANQGGFRPM